MTCAGKSETIECVRGPEERAVSALTQLMKLYLDKNSLEKQRIAISSRGRFNGRNIDEVVMTARDIPANTLGVALKNGMRAVGSTLYEETKSTEAMNDVLYRVMEKFPSRDQEVIRVLDHAFDGIGGWWA